MARRRQSDPLQHEFHWWHRWKLSTQKFAVVLTMLAVAAGFTYVFITNHTADTASAPREPASEKVGGEKVS